MEQSSSSKGHIVRRILVAAFCLAVMAVVLVVMLFFNDPSTNSFHALGSVYMDIVCITVLIIVISSFIFDDYGLYQTTRLFEAMVIITIWALFLDFLNWAFDGSLQVSNMTFWFTAGSLCTASLLACLFTLYISNYMEENHRLSKIRKHANVCAVLNIMSFALTFSLAITGTAFSYVDGHYETGALYDLVEVIPVMTLLYMCAYVIRYSKKIGLRDVLVVTGYILFMVSGALIESSLRIGTTYVAVALADVFIFVMLQNDVIAQEKRNVQKWIKKSNTDALTGFFNRFAYEADVRKFENDIPADDFVYVSMDVNSLKSVNDTFGHNAGDELLIGAAKCLKACFGPYGKLYRIGGDEFVAFIYANEKQLESIKKDIEETTEKWSGELVKNLAISCGYVTQKESNNMSVKQMAVLADRRMYEAKAEYYKNIG